MMRPNARECVYHAIDTERDYQNALPAIRTDGKNKTVGDYITMLGHYHAKLVEAWTKCSGNEVALDVMRKCAGIAVRCMEEHGAPVRVVLKHKPQDPVFFKPSGTWWHTDETWSENYGPFDTEEVARDALAKYCDGLDGTRRWQPPTNEGEKRTVLSKEQASALKDAISQPMPDAAGFKGADELEWLDISDEQWREYVYPDGTRYRVHGPLELNVKKKSGGHSHRIKTVGTSIYVATGWVAIEWDVKPGKERFAF